MKRRGFFKSLAKAAAIVALAPQLAFRVKPDLPVWNPADYQGEWTWTTVRYRLIDGKFVKV